MSACMSVSKYKCKSMYEIRLSVSKSVAYLIDLLQQRRKYLIHHVIAVLEAIQKTNHHDTPHLWS